jgi:tRNA nucleotidyltransferase/poly(A) polymerase
MSDGLEAARAALADGPAWLVGGAVRDVLLDRPSADYDIVVDGDPARAAKLIARAGAPAACFALSEEFGSWRVCARDGSWQVDVEPLRAPTL